jgi:hypothetical protein
LEAHEQRAHVSARSFERHLLFGDTGQVSERGKIQDQDAGRRAVRHGSDTGSDRRERYETASYHRAREASRGRRGVV